MIEVIPYLFFKGNASEAMDFYQRIFGGKLDKVPYNDTMPAPKGLENGLMHAYLGGGDVVLMASDTAEASDVAKKISISLNGNDEEKLTKFFNALSEDVRVNYPLKKEAWGDVFGAVVDKYGIEWMVNISKAKQ